MDCTHCGQVKLSRTDSATTDELVVFPVQEGGFNCGKTKCQKWQGETRTRESRRENLIKNHQKINGTSSNGQSLKYIEATNLDSSVS